MLKGTMKIELTDVHTGKTETVLEQNMVTNQLSNIFRHMGYCKDPDKLLTDWAPHYKTLLGGLLLFDTPIEEDPDNVYPPAEANLVGCAVYNMQNSTTNTVRGGYNATESELNTANGYMKYVYDFTTAQANGTIACACLTHVNAGYSGYGGKDVANNSSTPTLGLSIDTGAMQYVYTNYTGGSTGDHYSGLTLGTTEVIFLVDPENDCVYYFRLNSAKGITIIKRRAQMRSISLLRSPRTTKPILESTTLSLTTSIPTSYISWNFDTATNALYICGSSASYKAANTSFLITKIEFDTWAVTQYSMSNTTGVQITTNGTRFCHCHDGYAYVKSYNSPYEIYKLEIGNAANVVKMNRNGFTVSGTPQFAINGRIYYESNDDQLRVLCS
ncbi:MAG: hypothetical protein IJ422_08825, partial [Oscillospiraceae bacterium]|nr:hypothetical protein [Oscillospiraceae bacterium]